MRFALVPLFWLMAAALVAGAQLAISPRWLSAAATIAALIVIAYAYSRFAAREAGISHALGVGIAWLLLSVVSEIALTRGGQTSLTLLGAPDRPLLRNVLLFAWIFAPAAFARRTLRNH